MSPTPPTGWSKTGFTQVSPEVYERRAAACLSCPHLVEPTGKPIYKVSLPSREDARICALAGSVASRMARMPSERCPDRDPSNPAVSRWGEPAA